VALHAMSSFIVVLPDKRFLHGVAITDREEGTTDTVVDLFSAEGQFLISRRLKWNMYLKTSDSIGRLYAIETADYPSIKRYRVSLSK
jgi:hypothetical protein